MPHLFPARYSSRCDSCDERIREGDLVTFGGTSVIHADCTDTQVDERPVVTCPTCCLTVPCGCEDD